MATGLAALDLKVTTALYQKVAPCVPRPLLKVFELMGDGFFWLPLPAVLWMLPSVVAPPQRLYLFYLALGFVLDLIVIGTVKSIVQRPRPSYNQAGDMNLVVSVDKYSFPSGHSSRCMFIASLALVILEDPLARMAVCGWAGLTAASRVALGRHYVGDVLAGTVVGVVLTAALTRGTFHTGGLWVPPAGHYVHTLMYGSA